jgi:transcriptional regulator with XRE-family HTH domain
MNKMESIGYRIRRVRALTGLSQEEFATQVNVSRSVLSQIEIDKIRPSLDVLSAISKLYNVPYIWLIEGGQDPDELKDIGYTPKGREESMDADVMFSMEAPASRNAANEYSDTFGEEDIKSARNRLLAQIKESSFFSRSAFRRVSERRIEPIQENDGSIWLVPEYLFSNYFQLSIGNLLEDSIEKIQLPPRSLHPRYKYRAFEVPDNRMSPLLEKGDILIGYQQNDPRDLVLLSLYILALEYKVVFGVLTGITETHYLFSHNPVNDYQVEYRKDEIKEFWLVDKVLNDNFTSRFRQAQMMMMQSNPLARNIPKGYERGI